MNSKPSSDLTDIDTIKRFDGRYRGIHRAILAGLLGQIAYRCEKNLYQPGAGRQLFLAPGSSLRETARTRTSLE